MCELCRQYPCHPACPNADPPRPLCTCKECKEGIYDGDRVVEIDGDYYHVDCLYEMSFEDLLRKLDIEPFDADEERIA